MVEGCLVVLSHRDETGSLLPSWPFSFGEVVGPERHDEGVRRLFEQFNNRVVERILVLVKPANDSVANLRVHGG